jgi:hypothetical protein
MLRTWVAFRADWLKLKIGLLKGFDAIIVGLGEISRV